MFHLPPHRVRPRFHALISIATLGLGALLLSTTPHPLAVQADPHLQGSVPKAPPYVLGYPRWFPQTVDFRPRQGGVVAADIDGDGRKDLVVSVPSGVILVVHPDGTLFTGWPRTFGVLTQPAFPMGEPAVGDLDGDGSPDIVTCVVSGSPMRRNYLYAMRADGTDLPGWPIELVGGGEDFYTCSNTPTLLADLDGDGNLEVIRGMNKGTILGFNRFGEALSGPDWPGWPVRLGPDVRNHVQTREINADLVIADMDGDGKKDLVFVESGLRPRLAAVSSDGRLLNGYPLWLTEIVDREAPVVADLDGDGHPEIVQATMPFDGVVIEPSPEPGAGPAVPANLHALRADGSDAHGWPRLLQSGASWGAVITDLDGDGRLEVLQQDGAELVGFDVEGNPLPGYPVVVHRDFVRSQSVDISPWAVGDLNGDRRPDLLQVWSNQYNGISYLRVFGLRAAGNPIRGFPFDATGMVAASRPVLTDLSGDGVNDLVMLVAKDSNGGWLLTAWDLGTLAPRMH
jgi:VCBS repeat protein